MALFRRLLLYYHVRLTIFLTSKARVGRIMTVRRRPYQILEFLGRGAHGEVYAAKTTAGEMVTLKVCEPEVHKRLQIAEARGVPTIIIPKETERLSAEWWGENGYIYRYVHGISIRDVTEDAKVDPSLKNKIRLTFYSWRNFFNGPDFKFTATQENVLLEIETGRLFLADPS
jgi:hypothetical protein